MIGGRGAAMALSSLLLMGPAWAWAPASQADPGRHSGGVQCTGPSESTYNPSLTLTPRETRVHTKARYQCTVAPGRPLSATGSLNGVSPQASCVALTSSRLTEDVRYADGKRSLIAYSGSTTLRVAGVLVVRLTGRVTEGRGKGHSVQRTVAALPSQPPTQCLSSGLQGSSGQAHLEIQP